MKSIGKNHTLMSAWWARGKSKNRTIKHNTNSFFPLVPALRNPNCTPFVAVPYFPKVRACWQFNKTKTQQQPNSALERSCSQEC